MKVSIWRKFPKWALALTIIVVSTGLFAFWYFFLYPRWWGNGGSNSSVASSPSAPSAPEPSEWDRRREKAAILPSRMAGLVVAGNDLYDALAGELIFKNWLQGGCPPKVFYDAANQRIIGKVERGLIRYELTGQKEKVMGEPFGAAFTDGHKLAVFAREGDIWKAEPDWASFTLTKELQVTKLGKFTESFLVQNIVMGTENMLIVRQMPNLLQVDMNTGAVKPLKLPPGSSFQNQSPDGRMLVGMVRERTGPSFYAYDAEKDSAETFALGRSKAIGDVLWLGNDRCAVLVNGDLVYLYDRKLNSFDQFASLPIACNKMLGPSPEGKRFFCGSRKGAFLVDVEVKSVTPFKYPAESMGWISNDVLVFANDLPDTSLRGTYYMRIGNEPQRILEEPILASRDGNNCLEYLRQAETIVFGTKSSLFRMGGDGGMLKEVASWQSPSPSLIVIEPWGKE
jgi:hypothetical protein